MAKSKINFFQVFFSEDEWARLVVHPNGDAVCEDGYDGEVSNTWWPKGKEPSTEDEWDDRYEALMSPGQDVEVNEVDVGKKRFAKLVQKYIGDHTSF